MKTKERLKAKISVFFVISLFLFTASAQAKVWKIAILSNTGANYLYRPMVEGLKEGLFNCGFAEGKDIEYVSKGIFAPNKEGVKKTENKVKEALNKKVDIVITCGTPVSRGAWRILKNTNVAQIYVGVTDPIYEGFIDAVGKPTGKNITGITYYQDPADGLELTRRILPEAKKYAFIIDMSLPQDQSWIKYCKAIKNTHGFEIEYFFTSDKDYIEKINKSDIDAANAWMAKYFHKELYTINKPMIGLSTMGSLKAGEVAGYSLDTYTMGAQAAVMAAKIIAGTSTAGEISPELPRKQVLLINLIAASKYGVKIPFDLMIEAEKIFR